MAGKVSKESVNYRRAWLVARKRCGNCSMFRPDRASVQSARATGRCTLVEGLIVAGDVCDRWEARR